MYNRYIPNGTAYIRVPEPEPAGPARPEPSPAGEPPSRDSRDPQGGIGGLLSPLSGLLRAFRLEDLDTGDVLLLLILLFLFRDGDDLEMVITLGLLLLLGPGDAGASGQPADCAS